jgi:3-methyladenine DNA glycosylase/8-oxoguanine DNA glycosylase
MHSVSQITLKKPHGFDLSLAVASYGYFLLAPNYWDIKRAELGRPLHRRDGRIVRCVISQRSDAIVIACDRSLPRNEHPAVKQQVARMLRLKEDQRDWHRICPDAKRAKFGWMFRSPTLFEDMVKTITSCNVTWRNTIVMNRLLVEHVGDGAFPTPIQIVEFGSDRLKMRCKVGYRAERIVRLARGILEGAIDLDWFEQPQRTSSEIFDAIRKLYGFGPYAAGNLCHLLGRYDKLAIDTETYRHFCHHYRIPRPDNPLTLHDRIEQHYGRFGDYAFKAYWFELWQDYEQRYGPAYTWDRDTTGQNFTAAVLNGEA